MLGVVVFGVGAVKWQVLWSERDSTGLGSFCRGPGVVCVCVWRRALTE